MRPSRLTKNWGIDELSFDTVAVPAPGPGQVLVRLKAVSLNYRDLMVVRGTYAPYLVRPRVLGSDGAGEVVAVGEGVAAFAVGDRVAGSFFPEWIDGRYLGRYHKSSLGGSDTDGVLVTAPRLFG